MTDDAKVREIDHGDARKQAERIIELRLEGSALARAYLSLLAEHAAPATRIETGNVIAVWPKSGPEVDNWNAFDSSPATPCRECGGRGYRLGDINPGFSGRIECEYCRGGGEVNPAPATPFDAEAFVRRCAAFGVDHCDENPWASQLDDESTRFLTAELTPHLRQPAGDDGEPLTEEWLREIGFTDYARSNAHCSSYLSFWIDRKLHNVAFLAVHWARPDNPEGHYWSCQGYSLYKPAYPETRGQLRRLLSALGVGAKLRE